MDVTILKEIGEWAAVGFYEGEHLPFPRKYGLAYKRAYEHMDVRINVDTAIVPCEPFYQGINWAEDWAWTSASCILNHHHSHGLTIRSELINRKKADFPQYADFIDAFHEDLSKKISIRTQYIHSNPDIVTIVRKGFQFIKDELEQELKAAQEPDEVNFLIALKDYCDGIDAYFQTVKIRLTEKLLTLTGEQRATFELLLSEFAQCFYKPATSFIQGLLAVNFTWMLDGCDSIGRLDYVLGGLFEADIDSGKLELDFARKMLDDFFALFQKFNGWNIQIGGVGPDGKDCCNLLTKELLLTCGRTNLARPNVAFRINAQTNPEYYNLALEMLVLGGGRPALYNDDLYIKLLMENFKEMPYEDAAMYGFGGCTETMIPGMSCVDSLTGSINLAYALSLAMFNGFDILKQEQVGPKTGAFENFDAFETFYNAVKQQISFMTEQYVTYLNEEIEKRLTSGDPKIPRSLFTRDCVKSRRSFEAGGARYNWVVTSYDGSSVLIDSLIAIKEAVFEKGLLSQRTLVESLRNDFKGYEAEQILLTEQLKFGNDIVSVDLLGADILEYAWNLLLQCSSPRGGKHVPSIILYKTYAFTGKGVCASANGRHESTYLNDSVGACQGVDVNGPTALINSVLRLPNHLAFGTPVLNMRIHKNMLSTQNGLQKYRALIDNFFLRGGLQIQVSVLDHEQLLAAQENPEEHRDIIVRIGGFSEYFVNLTKELQDSVIKRSEHL